MLEDEDLDWDDDEDEDTESPQPDPVTEPETPEIPETPPTPEPPSPPAATGELEKLRQKVRSAEGRYAKFGDDIDQMRSELEAMEQEQPAAADTAPVLPDGWTERDWEDFVADSPVEAELLQAQNERLATLQNRVDTAEREKLQSEQLQTFRGVVLGAHPDYEQLMQAEGEQVKSFIDTQANPLVKKAYQQVYQQGTAEEVVELVNQYKLSRGSRQQSQQADRHEQRVNSSLAVPSRAPVPDSSRYGGLPPEDDEDAAWDYFSDEAI